MFSTQKPSRQKWLSFELICAVYLEYIVIIHFVSSYPDLQTFYVQWYFYYKLNLYVGGNKMHPAQPRFAQLGGVHNKPFTEWKTNLTK